MTLQLLWEHEFNKTVSHLDIIELTSILHDYYIDIGKPRESEIVTSMSKYYPKEDKIYRYHNEQVSRYKWLSDQMMFYPPAFIKQHFLPVHIYYELKRNKNHEETNNYRTIYAAYNDLFQAIGETTSGILYTS